MRQKIFWIFLLLFLIAAGAANAQNNRGYSESGPNQTRDRVSKATSSDDDSEFMDDDDSPVVDDSKDDANSSHHYVDAQGRYHPGADSPTAMRNCGVTLHSEISKGFTFEITLTEDMPVKWMRYCKDGEIKTAHTIKRKRNGKVYGIPIVLPAGTRIRANPNNDGIGLALGCLNEFGATNIPRPAVAYKRKENPPPPPRMCKTSDGRDMNVTLEEWLRDDSHSVTKDGRCIEPVAEKPVPKATPVVCKSCADFQVGGARFVTKKWTSHLANWKEDLAAGLDGFLTSIFASSDHDWKDGAIGGGLSVIKTNAIRMFIPRKDTLTLMINGQAVTVRKKGHESVRAGSSTLELSWDQDNTITGRSDGNICFYAYLQDAFVYGSVTIVDRNGKRSVIPVKSENNVPIRPVRDSGSTTATTNRRPTLGNPTGAFALASDLPAEYSGGYGQQFADNAPQQEYSAPALAASDPKKPIVTGMNKNGATPTTSRMPH